MLEDQTKIISTALKLLPKEHQQEGEAALEALKTLMATIEVQGTRILQLNDMIPLDEVGNPATQQYVNNLLRRPRV